MSRRHDFNRALFYTFFQLHIIIRTGQPFKYPATLACRRVFFFYYNGQEITLAKANI